MRVDNMMLSKEAIAALERGRLIEAIKHTRAATGMGLKESKEAVETYLLQNLTLKEKIDATRVSVSISLEHVAIVVIAIVLLGMYFVLAR
ncbi:MAG: hypothetical protein WC009_08340 [Methylotenera sp.]